jgi:cytochrome c peroxidase
VDLRTGRVVARPAVPEANMLQGVAVSPGRDLAYFTLMRTKNLIPTTRTAQGWVITNGLGVLSPDGRVDQVLLDEPAEGFPDAFDVAISPDRTRAVVVSAGADEIAILDLAKLTTITSGAASTERNPLPNLLGGGTPATVSRIRVGRNPRAVVLAPDRPIAYVANALDDSVTVVDFHAGAVLGTIDLGGPTAVSEIRRGERLFHSAETTAGRQFSCRSCHPDGHHTGMTFDIEADGLGMHPADNRTLQGIFDTPPFKWEGTNPSLHRQCGPRFSVFFTRLTPFTGDDLDALVRYMSTIQRPPNRYREPQGLTLAQRRGKEIFERSARNDGTPLLPQQRCAHCHSGAYRTDQSRSEVATTMWFDAPVNVDLSRELENTDDFGELGGYYFVDVGVKPKVLDNPHLTNIADSPPYLHNGAAGTLEEIWTRFNITDRHGAAADLTRAQLNDLIAYLKSQ